MRRPALVVLLCGLQAGLFFGTAGCGKRFDEIKKGRPAEAPPFFLTTIEKKFKPLRATSWDGVLRGRVVYRGEPPQPRRFWNHGVSCCRGDTDPDMLRYSHPFLVNEEGGLAEVVVFLRQPKTVYYLPTPEALQEREDHVVFKAPFCVIVPRVAVHVPMYRDARGERVKTGQKLIADRSSDVLHNFWMPLPRMRGEADLPRIFQEFEVEPSDRPKSLYCTIHPWMKASVLILDHPYAAITNDDGRFELRGLPTRVPVEVAAWHPEFGFLGKDGAQGRTMKLDSGINAIEVVVPSDEGKHASWK